MSKKSVEQILATQVSIPFIDGMKNRMIMGYFRYGPIQRGFPKRVNAIESLKLRLKQYEDTGNTEFLMDVANYAMIEFMLPAHPQAHFRQSDENESPGYVSNDFDVRRDSTDQLSEDSWDELQKHRKSLKEKI